jgi:Domain of unknown function DUF83
MHTYRFIVEDAAPVNDPINPQQIVLDNGVIWSRFFTDPLVFERWELDILDGIATEILPIQTADSQSFLARFYDYPNHMIQVLAYCVLVMEHYNEPVPYGLVVYGENKARKVYPTEDNLAWLNQVIDQVCEGQNGEEKNRSHRQRGRCLGCGLREKCDQALVSPPGPQH